MNKRDDCPNPDDALMLRVATDSDTSAFAFLVRRHQARLISFAARLFDGDIDTGADIAQETFVKVWRQRNRYVAQGKFLAYLLHIAHNICISRLRSPESKVGELQLGEELPATAATMDSTLAVRIALRQLPEEQRVVFLLHEYEGLSYAEISDTLLIAPGTVASRKSAAVQALRKSLSPWFG